MIGHSIGRVAVDQTELKMPIKWCDGVYEFKYPATGLTTDDMIILNYEFMHEMMT